MGHYFYLIIITFVLCHCGTPVDLDHWSDEQNRDEIISGEEIVESGGDVRTYHGGGSDFDG